VEHPDPHRNNEKIVTLTTCNSPVEAEALASELHAQGIVAEVNSGTPGIVGAELAFADGYPVQVFEGDLEAAQRIVRDIERDSASE
jgi:hypothetical protein